MIEPLRYHNESATTFEIERPSFCISCQSMKSMESNPNVAVVYCADCPSSFVAGNKSAGVCGRGAFLCKKCESDKHKHGASREHKRQILVVGPGVRKRVVVRGDAIHFPMVLDKVEVKMKARIYHNGRRVHREHTREIPFVVGMSGKCVHVQILGARNLRCSDMNGTADPFVVYSFCGKPLHNTRVRHRTLNPRWDNETIVVPIDENLPMPRDCTASQKDIFRLEVFDKDFLSNNDFLGQIEMHRTKLMKLAVVAQEQPIRIPLTSREIGGLLHIQLAMTAKMVFIKIVAAEDLDKRDVSHLNNAYVKVFLGDPANTLLGMTPVVKNSISPIWTNHNVFSVPMETFLSAEAYIAAQVRFYRTSHNLAATTAANTASAAVRSASPPTTAAEATAAGHQRRQNIFIQTPTNLDDHVLDEFNTLPDFLGILRLEVHDRGSGMVPLLGRPSELLGRTAIHLDTVRRHLPNLPSPLYQTNDNNNDNDSVFSNNNNTSIDSASNYGNDLAGLVQRSRQPRRYSLAHNPTIYALRRSMTTSFRSVLSAGTNNHNNNHNTHNSSEDLYSPNSSINNSRPSTVLNAHHNHIDLRDPSNSLDELGDEFGFEGREDDDDDNDNDNDQIAEGEEENEDNEEEGEEDEEEEEEEGDNQEEEEEGEEEENEDDENNDEDNNSENDEDVEAQTKKTKKKKGGNQQTSATSSSSRPDSRALSLGQRLFSFASINSNNNNNTINNNNNNNNNNVSTAGSFFSMSRLSSRLTTAASTTHQHHNNNNNRAAAAAAEESPVFGPLLRLQLMRQSRLNMDALQILDQHQQHQQQQQDGDEDLGYLVVRLLLASRGAVLQGLDLAVQRMSVGETAHIKCRFDLAYGSYCLSAHIPPRANVVFTVQLLSLNQRGRDVFSVTHRVMLRIERVVAWLLQYSVGQILWLVWVALKQLVGAVGHTVMGLLASREQRLAREKALLRARKRRRRRHRRNRRARRRGNRRNHTDGQGEDADNNPLEHSEYDSDNDNSDDDENDSDDDDENDSDSDSGDSAEEEEAADFAAEHDDDEYYEDDNDQDPYAGNEVAKNHVDYYNNNNRNENRGKPRTKKPKPPQQRPRTIKPDKFMQKHLTSAVRAGGTLLFNYQVQEHESAAQKRQRQIFEARMNQQNPNNNNNNSNKNNNNLNNKPMMQRSNTSKLRLLQELTQEQQEEEESDNEEEDEEEKDRQSDDNE